MTTDELAILHSIVTHPAEDTPRLSYADYLDLDADPRQPERAAFIRCQLEIVKLEAACNGHYTAEDNATLNRLYNRANKLIKRAKWKLAIPGMATWTRGFISSLTLSAADWLRHHAAIAWCPQRCPTCKGKGDYAVAGGVTMDCDREECPTCRGVGTVPPTDRCPAMCADGTVPTDREDNNCGRCKGTGRVARPFRETVQPLVTVTLSTRPLWGDLPRMIHLRSVRPMSTTMEDVFAAEWPGITFHLPTPAPDDLVILLPGPGEPPGR